MPYEDIVELVNETGKDLWINIPEQATDSFVQQFAHFLRMGLDMNRIMSARAAQGSSAPFQLMVEYANETWNGSFTAYNTFLTAAMANPTRYTGTSGGTNGPSFMSSDTDLMRVGQYEADGLVRIGNAFRTEFAMSGMQSAVAPVLAGWALGAAYSDDGLQFIQANVGNPSDYVRYVAIAPYVSPDDAQTGSLVTLFPSLETNITSMDSVFQDFARLVAADGIQMSAYEGGQGISGNTNIMIKYLAEHDARMHTAYLDLFTLWKMRFGDALFMHFDLAGTPGLPQNTWQYGFWGSIDGVMVDTSTCGQGLSMLTDTTTMSAAAQWCPKYQALAEQVP